MNNRFPKVDENTRLMTRKIQYMEAYLNYSACIGFLYYPSDPFDLAIVCNGKKIIAKPIIQYSADEGYFNNRGNTFFLRNFRDEDKRTRVPDWAIKWVQDRIEGKPYKIDFRLSATDAFVLDNAINTRKKELQRRLISVEQQFSKNEV